MDAPPDATADVIAQIAALPTPPRRVRRRPNRVIGTGCFLIFIIPFTLVGIFDLLSTIQGCMVKSFGTLVPGTVTRFDVGSETTGEASPANYFTIGYEYWVNGVRYTDTATEFTTERGVDTPAAYGYRVLPAGSPVMVKVLPITPHWNQYLTSPKFTRSDTDPDWGTWFFVLSWNAIFFVVWWICLSKFLIQRSLILHGVAVKGEIVDKKRTGGNRGPRYELRYLFQPDGKYPWGSDTIAGTMTIDGFGWDNIRIGQSTIVLFDPARPTRSVAYPFADYEAY